MAKFSELFYEAIPEYKVLNLIKPFTAEWIKNNDDDIAGIFKNLSRQARSQLLKAYAHSTPGFATGLTENRLAHFFKLFTPEERLELFLSLDLKTLFRHKNNFIDLHLILNQFDSAKDFCSVLLKFTRDLGEDNTLKLFLGSSCCPRVSSRCFAHLSAEKQHLFFAIFNKHNSQDYYLAETQDHGLYVKEPIRSLLPLQANAKRTLEKHKEAITQAYCEHHQYYFTESLKQIEQLPIPKGKEAEVAKLKNSLSTAAQYYFANNYNTEGYKLFKNSCHDAISEARTQIDNPSWAKWFAEILATVLLCAASLGFGLWLLEAEQASHGNYRLRLFTSPATHALDETHYQATQVAPPKVDAEDRLLLNQLGFEP